MGSYLAQVYLRVNEYKKTRLELEFNSNFRILSRYSFNHSINLLFSTIHLLLTDQYKPHYRIYSCIGRVLIISFFLRKR